jgi:ribonuclease P protein component
MAGTAGARAGHRGARSAGPGRARLSRSGDFDRVFRQGRSHAARELVLYVFPRDSDDQPRLGLSVSRKVGGAVERNRVKRMLREAFATEGARLPAGTDAVLVARPDARSLIEREGLPGVTAVLRDLVARAAPDPGDAGDREPGPPISDPASNQPRLEDEAG